MWSHLPLSYRTGNAPGSVLVVEDDHAISEVICLILESEGYRVILNSNGDIFSDSLPVAPDLILLDIWLPSMNGGEVCRRLKEDPELSVIPVIMMSANTNLQSIASACQADDFLPKPFDIDLLIAKVHRYVA